MPRKAKSENSSSIKEIEETIIENAEQSSEDPIKGSRRQSKEKKREGRSRGAYWISSGSDLLDAVIGGGRGYGYETGMSVLFEAQSSAGKSFLAHEVIASAYHKYKDKCKWLYLDVESGCTFDSKALYGVEIMPPNVQDRKRPKTIEDCHSEIMLFGEKLADNEFGIIVVDSLDGLLSEEMEERTSERTRLYSKGKEYDKGSYGMAKAKYLSQEFFPTVNEMVERKNILLLIISQYRQTQGQYGSKNTISNGEALKYYTHARVRFTKKREIEVKDRSIGAVIQAETLKMKGPRPYRHCYFTLHYTRGIDNTLTNIDFAYDLLTKDRAEMKKGAEDELLTFNDKNLNRHDLAQYIENNDLEHELKKCVWDKWEAEELEASKPLEGRKPRYA